MTLNRSATLAEAFRLLALAWPVMLTSLNWTLMHLIDVAIVGNAGPGELGALAAGRALTFVTIVIGVASLSGIIVFTARHDGAGEQDQCGDVLRRGLVCAAGIGLPVALALYIWAEPVTRLIGIAPAVVPEGARVVKVMALAFPSQMLLAVMAYFLEGVSRPVRGMIVNLAMLPLNAVLAWAWTDGHLGFPAEGAVGAVSATALVSLLGVFAMALAVWTLPRAHDYGIRRSDMASWGRAFREAPGLIAFGLIPGLAAGLEMAGFSLLISLSTRLGPVATDAFQAVFSLHNLSFALAIGLASAAGVRVGNAVGENDMAAAVPRAMIACGLLLLVQGGLLGTYILAAPTIVALFSEQEAVRTLAASLLVMLAPFTLFDGLQMVLVYALRSLGDQIAAGVNGIIAFFLVTGGLGLWLVLERGEGPHALVVAAAAGMVSALLLQGGRFWFVTRKRCPRSSG